MRVPSHASVSKYYADKTYANLWFIFLQVTKGFRFQKKKNERFISGNFSSDRFWWKVKTIWYGLHILINKHLQYRCLEFTMLKCRWRIFAKKKLSNLLIIHEKKTKEIRRSFALIFSKNYQCFEKPDETLERAFHQMSKHFEVG